MLILLWLKEKNKIVINYWFFFFLHWGSHFGTYSRFPYILWIIALKLQNIKGKIFIFHYVVCIFLHLGLIFFKWDHRATYFPIFLFDAIWSDKNAQINVRSMTTEKFVVVLVKYRANNSQQNWGKTRCDRRMLSE